MSGSTSDKVMRVLVVEDDPYARDMMAMLLVRDWRTYVEADVATLAELQKFLKGRSKQFQKLDLMLINVEHPQVLNWAFELTSRARNLAPGLGILFSGTYADLATLQEALALKCRGYILSSEALYALVGIIRATLRDVWVTTPSIWQLARARGVTLPDNTTIMSASASFARMTPRERQIARLAILFNLRHTEIADELNITPGQVAKYVSSIYGILGLRELLNGEELVDNEHGELRRYILALKNKAQAVTRKDAGAVAAPEKSTLAFHLLTAAIEHRPDQLL